MRLFLSIFIVLCFKSYQAQSAYCIPAPTNGINGHFIAHTKLESLDTTDTGSGTSYKFLPDSLSKLTCFLRPGFTYKLYFTSGTHAVSTIAAWIDYNNDTVIGNSERLGLVITTIAGQQDSISFTVPFNCVRGKLRLRIRASNSGTVNACANYSSGQTIDYSITVLNPNYEYNFVTGWEFSNTGVDYINGVKLQNINNQNTGGPHGPFYSDYARKTTNITACNNYKLFINSVFNLGSTGGNYVDAFIDFNNDGVFDRSEKLDSVLLHTGANADSITFAPPDYPGQKRLRVRMFTNHVLREVEDYTVNVVTTTTSVAPSANFSANLYYGCDPNCGYYGCVGQINFFDFSCGNPSSWNWSVDGAFPPVSTQQNPSFSFPTTGAYDVILVAANAIDTDTIVKQVYILPPVTSFSLGNNVTRCVGDSVLLSGPTSLSCYNYKWSTGEISRQIYARTTGTYFLRVESCTHADCPAYDTVVVNFSPSLYNVTGGGSNCGGGTGFGVGLSDSDQGITYQLYVNGNTVGGPVTGNGNAISFGNQNVNGYYYIRATNNALGCSAFMNDSATISIGISPNSYNVYGGGTYCSGGTGLVVSIDSSDTTVSYQLYRNGNVIGAPVIGVGGVLDFPPHLTAGNYTVIGTDVNTTCTVSMTGSANINVTQGPAVHNVSGGGTFCGGVVGGILLDDSDLGVSYEIYESGTPTGIIESGTGTALNFPSPTTSGSYTIIGSDSTACTTTMAGNANLTIKPAPKVFNVFGGGYYCGVGQGVIISVDSSELGMNYRLYSGGFPYGGIINGTGDTLHFSLTAPGDYVVRAVNTTNGCAVFMHDTAKILLGTLPDIHNITGGGHYCFGGAGVSIGLDTSDTGVQYQLFLGTDSVGSPVQGTGLFLNFGMQTGGGDYTIVASAATTSCTIEMEGNATIIIDSLPSFHITSPNQDTLCIFDPPLYLSGTPAGGAFTGDGVLNDSLYSSLAGIGFASYTYAFTDITNGCTYTITDSVLVDICNAISENDLQNSVSVYPNPANSEIYFSLPAFKKGNVSVDIINETGELIKRIKIKTQNIVSTYRYSTADLTEGIYLLKFNIGEKSFSKKVQVVH